jgi:hypothetical protein
MMKSVVCLNHEPGASFMPHYALNNDFVGFVSHSLEKTFYDAKQKPKFFFLYMAGARMCTMFYYLVTVIQWNKGDVIVQRFCESVYHQKAAFGSVWTVLVSI